MRWSDLFRNIFRDYVNEDVGQLLNGLKEKFYGVVDKKDQLISEIVGNIPESWGLGSVVLKTKLDELFDREWVDRCWECFVEYFNGCVNGSDAI